jgi:hypothetical protein
VALALPVLRPKAFLVSSSQDSTGVASATQWRCQLPPTGVASAPNDRFPSWPLKTVTFAILSLFGKTASSRKLIRIDTLVNIRRAAQALRIGSDRGYRRSASADEKPMGLPGCGGRSA